MSPGFDSSSFRLIFHIGDVAQLAEQSAFNRRVAGTLREAASRLQFLSSPFWKMPPTGRQLVLKTRIRQ